MSIYDVFSGGNRPFDKEEWAAAKQAQRKEAYELIDNTCSEMMTSGDSFRQYLNVQGSFDRYSVATAVFFIKYLRTLGFDVTNDIFAQNAWYFRNALVRANYNDLKNGVHETTEYLELFLRNLLLDEKNELHNRSMHISGRFKETDFESAKADIENTEADIESQKANIRNKLLAFSDMISEKTINHTFELFSKCGKEEYFGRTIVEDITGLKSTRASELIKLLVDSKVIVSVTGHGKGKYRFQ